MPPAAETCPPARPDSVSPAPGTAAARARVRPRRHLRSSIASSNADCVRGVARLISSASRTLAKIGPGPKRGSRPALVEERDAGHVGRQQVGRELDASELAADRAVPTREPSSSCRCPAHLRSASAPRTAPRPPPARHATLADDHAIDVAAEPVRDPPHPRDGMCHGCRWYDLVSYDLSEPTTEPSGRRRAHQCVRRVPL